MSCRRTILLLLWCAAPLVGCGEESPQALNTTDPDQVARAWIEAFAAGDGSHVALEFQDVPDPRYVRWSGTILDLPQGVSVREIRRTGLGIGGGIRDKDGSTPHPFQLTDYAVGGNDAPGEPVEVEIDGRTYKMPQPEGMNAASRVSSEDVAMLVYQFTLVLQDGTKHRVGIAVRPTHSFEREVVVTDQTTWKVLPRRPK